jgi:hypothetical protein
VHLLPVQGALFRGHILKITHCNVEYDISHLAGRVIEMGVWTGKHGALVQAEIEVRFACHCYTGSSSDEPDPGTWSLREGREWRVFDVHRHSLSFHIPDIIETLIRSPRKSIQHVRGRHNFKIFQLGLKGVKPGEKYYIFMKIERTNRTGKPGFHQVKLSVESAYPKANIVAGDWRPQFGTAIEEILGIR